MTDSRIELVEKGFKTLNEVAMETGIEYHTLLARLKRDQEKEVPTYKAFNTKWGWMVHNTCFTGRNKA